jgi:neutral ceramidase
VELMQEYGRQLADAVDRALGQPLHPIQPSLEVAYQEIDLPFDTLPTRGELEVTATAERPQGPWANYLLSVWDRNGGLAPTYPYPIQAWRLGDEIDWVFLGGEVVVNYALRLKSEIDPRTTWVASYANDVMGYIPSRRVLAEGGYEGGGARFPYGLAAVWHPDVERQIINAVHQLLSGSASAVQD